MSIVTHSLGKSYLEPSELQEILKNIEKYVGKLYDDGKHIATIGIGARNERDRGN